MEQNEKLFFKIWDASDHLSANQFNIISANILAIFELLKLYTVIPPPNGIIATHTITGIFSASLLNSIELWLETAMALEGLPYEKVTFIAGKTPITYTDINRWETTSEKLYRMAIKNKDNHYICGELTCGGNENV